MIPAVAVGTYAEKLPFYDIGSASVRFWVQIDQSQIGASIGKATLHYRYNPNRTDDLPLETYLEHAEAINEVVRQRVQAGSREPIMLRDWDVRPMSDKDVAGS